METGLTGYAYLVSAVCFIFALRGLSSPITARRGNLFGVTGMVIAIGTTINSPGILSLDLIIIGILIGGSIGTFLALKIEMTALPQLVAAFHSLVGLAAVFVASAALYHPEAFGLGTRGDIAGGSLVEMSLGTIVGAITFSGSLIAFAKLQGVMSGSPITFKLQHPLNAIVALVIVYSLVSFVDTEAYVMFWLMVALSLLIGFLIIIPIGGADMPVVVSMLNSYSGWAACGIGFTLSNPALIITGALVGSSGAILSYIMCKGMNRSIFNVLLGGFGTDTGAAVANVSGGEERPVKSGAAEDAAFLMKNASKVIIVPGYGMAVAQAQHALREMADVLKSEGVEVVYAIHPVAGRMPGHMNVLLAESNVEYDKLVEMEDINPEFATCDVVLVLGANDVVNPAAKEDPASPIFGMPILNVEDAAHTVVNKRSMNVGYAGIDNDLFYRDKTSMLFGDAKKVLTELVSELKAL
jgi:NAD(P) transhydrogenase subunit beta